MVEVLAYALPALYALFVWWFSTGIILLLDRRPRHSHGGILAVAMVPLGAALCALAATRNDSGVFGTYVAFTSAILIWGWQEMAFLMGFITGPSRLPCPPEYFGLRRFTAAAQAIIYHEAALLASLVIVYAITRSGSNRVGVLTFLVLYVMRLSAKLNLFLGVRNRSEDFLPNHLRYLQTFFRRRTFNALFPFSVAVSSVVAALGWIEVFAHEPMSAQSLGLNFVCALLSLAILEHLFMVLPLNPSMFWGWATRHQSGA